MQECIGNYNFSIENICISRAKCLPLREKRARERAAPQQFECFRLHSACTVLAVKNQKYDGKESYYPQNQRADLQREG